MSRPRPSVVAMRQRNKKPGFPTLPVMTLTAYQLERLSLEALVALFDQAAAFEADLAPGGGARALPLVYWIHMSGKER